MGYALGMHTTLHQSSPSDTAAQAIFETHKQVWWCIVIMERVLALGTIQSGLPGRPFACRDPLLSDHLPSFYGRDLGVELPVGVSNNSALPTFKPSNPFARTAQATYILSLVLSHITNDYDGCESHSMQVVYLDNMIQAFAFSALEQGNNDKHSDWGHTCGAFFIAMWLAATLSSLLKAQLIW
ncbi:hypothetical protein BP5796_04533 [Coleophoma crateriformis]|uniref:Transcription factor domain-containing protein n=1 Tax=Coleophoma crateriformis TaxID=565419 RepID=A0A3D8S9L3_9HELO|nr:hypothetical protein BP5796_04533 [Coleophoma crateriformis]